MSSSPFAGPGRPVETAGRCATCGSRLRPAERWCSLCHRPATDPVTDAGTDPVTDAGTDPDAGTVPVAPGVPVVEVPVVEVPRPGPEVPVPELPAARSEPDPAVEAVAVQLLADLAAAEALRDRESGLGSLHQRLGGLSPRSTAILVAGIGGTLLLVAMILGLTLLGLLL